MSRAASKQDESLAEIVLRCRIENDLTQSELADKIGVSLGTLQNAEHGSDLNPRTAYKIRRTIEMLRGKNG